MGVGSALPAFVAQCWAQTEPAMLLMVLEQKGEPKTVGEQKEALHLTSYYFCCKLIETNEMN